MKLLFITSNRLGDAVLSTGLLDQALQRFKPTEVWIACGSIAAPLFQGVPNLKAILPIEKEPYARHWLQLWLRLVPRHWGMVIDLRNSVVSYTLLADKVFRFARADKTKHKAEQLAAVLQLPQPPLNKICLTQEAKAFAATHVPEGEPMLALCPTANWEPKTWPIERFIETAQRLPYKRIAVFGAAHERAQAESLLTELGKMHTLIDLIGKTDPLQAAACMQRASLCIANDSGLMHIAAAMGTPTLGLFGPSFDCEYRPWGLRTSFVRGAPYHGLDKTPDPKALMLAIKVDTVVEAAKKLAN